MQLRQTMSQYPAPHGAPQFSVTDLFTIGIGPSSSHTVGPMRAAASFAVLALLHGKPVEIRCELFGSLALTGKGHATDIAVMLGLSGWRPEEIEPRKVPDIVANIQTTETLLLRGDTAIAFHERDIVFRRGEFYPVIPMPCSFVARFADGRQIEQTYFSIGGGVILAEGQQSDRPNVAVPYPYSSAAELLAKGRETGLSIPALIWANEEAWRARTETSAFIDSVRAAMLACIERGLQSEGILPGGLKVHRRARALHQNCWRAVRAPILRMCSNG